MNYKAVVAGTGFFGSAFHRVAGEAGPTCRPSFGTVFKRRTEDNRVRGICHDTHRTYAHQQ